jgi:hypothetical protein
LTTDRKFCRFNAGRSTSTGQVPEGSVVISEIPAGGFCLSTFLIIGEQETRSASSSKVLLGRIDPKAPWDHIGALDKSRVEVHSKGWMLPSSHLIFGESPKASATRIASEQLELPDLLEFGEPKVASEVYRPARFPKLQDHWDIEFIFKLTLASSKLPERPRAWRELKFVDATRTKKSEIARSHGDILEAVGYRFAPNE